MPSYDYDATVSSITSHRKEAYGAAAAAAAADASIRLEHLNQSVELFANLSAQCPMTPLLWMQYAEDASGVVSGLLSAEGGDGTGTGDEAKAQIADTRLNILELAIEEWPGCALLRLRHLEAVMAAAEASSSSNEDNTPADSSAVVRKAFHDAISLVGRGSHRNEDAIVAAIYRLHVEYLVGLASASSSADEAVMNGITEEIGASYLFRAECPMKEENDTLADEIASTKAQVQGVLSSADDMAKIDEARIQASRSLGSFANLEDEVDVAMAGEYIMMPANALNGETGDASSIVDWNALLNGREAVEGTSRCLMGYGATNTSAAFAKYAGALSNRARKAGNMLKSRAANGKKDASTDDQNQEEANDEVEMFNSLAISVYERGLSECPTVESLWVTYVQYLARLVDQDRKSSEGKPIGQTRYVSLLKSACARAARNCPYSTSLFGMKMNSFAILAQVGAAVFDPDQLTAVIKEAIDGGFIPSPEGQLQVHLNAIRHVNRRILALSCTASPEEGGAPPKAYDELEPMDKSGKKKKRKQDGAILEITEYNDVDAETEQEISDLIDDVREMYDATDSFLKKGHASWTEGRAVLWLDRARAEAAIYLPLLRSVGDDDDDDDDHGGGNKKAVDQAVRCYERSVKAHQPPHPEQWSAYIRYVLGRNRFLGQDDEGEGGSDPPGAHAAMFRKVRGLFHRATSVVKSKRSEEQGEDTQQGQSSFIYFGLRDYESALSNLCHEFLDFERAFGSDESLHQASKIVSGKLKALGKTQDNGTAVSSAQNGSASNHDRVTEIDTTDIDQPGKRKAGEIGENTEDGPAEPAAKRARAESSPSPSAPVDGPTHTSNEAGKKTNLKVEKQRPEHKVVVGKLEYPAHPFTINVSNLSTETEDMDLIDTFAPKCGAIVHARILREKHQGPRHVKAKSKGAGLIQFEERESVEKALALDEEIGLHEKLIKIRRSHIPAVSKVPPGMHRTNPKGEGKNSKRNQKRREANTGDSAVSKNGPKAANVDAAKLGEDSAEKPKPTSTVSSLSFVPRGLHGKQHHKVKLDLKK